MSNNRKLYWFLAIFMFGIGDLTTTFYAMDIQGIVEMNTLYADMFNNGMKYYFVTTKAVVLLSLYLFERYVITLEMKYTKCIPFTIAVLGTVITYWNVLIILATSV